MPSLKRYQGFLDGRLEVIKAVLRHPINRGGALHALRDYFFWNAARYALDADFVLHMPEGIDLVLGREQNYATGIYVHSLPDFRSMLFLAHLLRKDELFADIGANVGMYSTWAARAAGAKVVAIEPVPSTFSLLMKNIRLNDLDSSIEAHQVAVGDTPGQVSMTSTKGGLNHVLEAGKPNAIAVEVATLDGIFTACPFAMKLDVEGFEFRALSGARAMLDNSDLRAIIIELQNVHLDRYGTTVDEVRSLLQTSGFSPHRYDPFTRLLEPIPANSTGDAIFVRPGSEVADRLKSARRIALPGFPLGL